MATPVVSEHEMTKPIQISEAEWDVMRTVWDDGPLTAARVIESLSETHDWNHRTVRTLLARLVEKGALAYDVDGSRYIYRAAVPREQCVRHESRSFLSKVFGGDVQSLLAHFVEDSALSEDELRHLRDLLEAKSPAIGRNND